MTDEKDMDVSQESAASDVSQVDESPEVAEAEGDTPSADSPEGAEVSEDSSEEASAEAGEEPEGEEEAGEANDSKVVNEEDADEGDAEAAMLAMLEDLPQENTMKSADDLNFDSASVSNAEFQQLQQPAGSGDDRNIDLLLDVDLPVSIELGHTKMAIADILALGTGSVVELNKLAGEPVDLLINHKVVARGEVVVVDENFGLRITQLMTPEERLKALADE